LGSFRISIFAIIAKLIERGQIASPVTLKALVHDDEDLAHLGGGAVGQQSFEAGFGQHFHIYRAVCYFFPFQPRKSNQVINQLPHLSCRFWRKFSLGPFFYHDPGSFLLDLLIRDFFIAMRASHSVYPGQVRQ